MQDGVREGENGLVFCECEADRREICTIGLILDGKMSLSEV